MKKYKYTVESWILYIWRVASEAFAYLSMATHFTKYCNDYIIETNRQTNRYKNTHTHKCIKKISSPVLCGRSSKLCCCVFVKSTRSLFCVRIFVCMQMYVWIIKASVSSDAMPNIVSDFLCYLQNSTFTKADANSSIRSTSLVVVNIRVFSWYVCFDAVRLTSPWRKEEIPSMTSLVLGWPCPGGNFPPCQTTT